MSTVPAIYNHAHPVSPLTSLQRSMSLLMAAGCLAVLTVAAVIAPDARGVGTHEAMGFKPCDFLARTGMPCPSCGMTTSFAYFARGNVLGSLWVQPFGLILAICTAASFWVALYMGLTGKPALRLLSTVPGRYYLIPLFALAVIGWGWKMLIILRGIDGWN